MTVQINKDLLTEYKDAVWKGFTLRELVSLLVGGGCALTVVVLLHRFFHMEPATAIYVAVPFALPAILIGFFKYQGYLGVLDLVKEMLFSEKCRSLAWDFEELPEAVFVFTMKKRKEKQTKRKGNRDHGIYDQSGEALP